MNTKTIESLQEYTKLLREMIEAPEDQLQDFAGEHPAYSESGKVCVEYMYAFSSKHPHALQQFAAAVLKTRRDPSYKIELINTGD